MSGDGRAARPGGRLAAIATTLGVLGLAVGGAYVTSDPVSGINAIVEGLSAGSGGLLADLGQLLPLGFAFAAGMVAAVNPCGFVLLPAYLGLFIAERNGADQVSTLPRLGRAIVVGASLTAGFVLLFAMVGLLIGTVAAIVVDALPWLGFSVGVGLILLGGYQLAGGTVYSAIPDQISARLAGQRDGGQGLAPVRGGYFLFGLVYGTASLSCTLPIFLGVLGGSLTTLEFGPAFGRLVLYGLGMGSVIMAATLIVALVKSATLRPLRGASRWVGPIGTAFLFLAGGYVVYYWLTVGDLLRR